MKLLQIISSIPKKGISPIEGIKQFQIPMQATGGKVLGVTYCDSPEAFQLSTSSFSIILALEPVRLGYRYAPCPLSWLREDASSFDSTDGIWQRLSFAQPVYLRPAAERLLEIIREYVR